MPGTVADCIRVVKEAAGNSISDEQARQLLDQIAARVRTREASQGETAEAAVRAVGNQILERNRLAYLIQRRNAFYTIKARRNILNFVRGFPTFGEGMDALINGTRKLVRGGRNSIDAQHSSIRDKYSGQLLAGLESEGVLREFKRGELDKEVFNELWQLNKENGTPGVTRNESALKIAKVIHGIQKEMVARENRAGAFIRLTEGYIMRQTHDPDLLARADGSRGAPNMDRAFQAWKEFISPLLDEERTFGELEVREDGTRDTEGLLRSTFESLVTSVHNLGNAPNLTSEFRGTGALAKKLSQPRVIHFKDADSAFAYNKRFGSRILRNGVLSDIRKASLSIALMENFGPNPDMTFGIVMRDLRKAARIAPNFEEQLKSLDTDWIENSFKQLSGDFDHPVSQMWHKLTRGAMSLSTLARLGGVVLSSIPDKTFFQSAMTYQGMRNMDVLAQQFQLFLPRTAQEKQRLHMMGAAIDGFLGDVASRFVANDDAGGTLFRLQQKLFQLNFMNWWNDAHKGGAAALEAAWYGSHHSTPYVELPADVRKILTLYDISATEWDVIRSTAYEVDGRINISPDRLSTLSGEWLDHLSTQYGLPVSLNNRLRSRDKLELKLRTLFVDQIEDAVITPGNRERLIMNWGTQAGTAKGSATRLLMHFKSFPIAVFERIVKREVYGHGSGSVGEWLLHDRKGNFRMAQLLALSMIGGYLSITIKDLLRGRTPRRLVDDEGNLNHKLLTDAMLRGGGLGIYGDFLLTEYDRSYKSALSVAAGPIFSQAAEAATIASDAVRGENVVVPTEKLLRSNLPFINLLYIRPAIDYLILWNLEEMLDPGSLTRAEYDIEEKNQQGFFIRPSEMVR